MKSLIQAVVIAAAVVIPVASFAQSNAPVTRAQVRAELVQLEQAGYRPAAGEDPSYPASIQAAQAKIQPQDSAFGGVADVSSAAGGPVSSGSSLPNSVKSVYFGR